MAGKKAQEKVSVDIQTLSTKQLIVRIVGTTPMLCNAMSAKAKQDLILPPRKKNKAEKEATLKHDPLKEYRASIYRSLGDDAPTRIVFPGGGIKAAIASAALRTPGATKTEIGQLCWISEWNVPIYGIPQMFMSVVRNAGMNRTPDVRTRAIVPEWAAEFAISFVAPNLNETAVGNLIASAGIVMGLGDWRPEKGKGSFGQYRLAPEGDEQWERVVATGGREAQDAALANPTCFDSETEELYDWLVSEAAARELPLTA